MKIQNFPIAPIANVPPPAPPPPPLSIFTKQAESSNQSQGKVAASKKTASEPSVNKKADKGKQEVSLGNFREKLMENSNNLNLAEHSTHRRRRLPFCVPQRYQEGQVQLEKGVQVKKKKRITLIILNQLEIIIK